MEHTIYSNYLSSIGRYSILTLRKSIENLHTVFSLFGNSNVIVTIQRLLDLAYRMEQDPEFSLYNVELENMLDEDTLALVYRYLPTNTENEETNYTHKVAIDDFTSLCKQVVLDLAELVEVLRIQRGIDLYRRNGYIVEIIGEDNFTLCIKFNIP